MTKYKNSYHAKYYDLKSSTDTAISILEEKISLLTLERDNFQASSKAYYDDLSTVTGKQANIVNGICAKYREKDVEESNRMSSSEEISKLHKKISNLKTRLDNVINDRDSLENHKQLLINSIRSKDERIAELKAKVSTYKANTDERYNIESEDVNQDLIFENDRLVQKVCRSDKTIDQLEKELNTAKLTIKELSKKQFNLVDANQLLTNSNAPLCRRITELECVNLHLVSQNNLLNDKITESKKIITQLEKELTTLQIEHKRLANDNFGLSTKHKETN